MKERLWKCADNAENHKRIINLYMILTVIGVTTPFVFGTAVSPDLAYLVGNRSVFLNPLLGALWAADVGIRWLATACVGLMIVYPIVLIAAYFLARIGKKYLPLVIAAFFDVGFTVFLTVGSICTAEFYVAHVLMFIGAAINLRFSSSILLIRRIANQQGNQKEMT